MERVVDFSKVFISLAWAIVFLGLSVLTLVLAFMAFFAHGFSYATQLRLVECGVCLALGSMQVRFTNAIILQIEEKYGYTDLVSNRR